jgi:hypothetical protein
MHCSTGGSGRSGVWWCECADNILRGNVPLPNLQKEKLKRNKAGLRALTKKSVSLKQKKAILQKGGFLGSLLAPIDDWSYSLRRLSADRSSLSGMVCIFLSKVSFTFTRCSTGGFGEILESVPKTMKAKIQLLLKKMKSSPDISWNEKGETV